MGAGDVAWLAAAAAMFRLFVGMMFMLFFGRTLAARADDAGANIGIADFIFAPTALTVKPGTLSLSKTMTAWSTTL